MCSHVDGVDFHFLRFAVRTGYWDVQDNPGNWGLGGSDRIFKRWG